MKQIDGSLSPQVKTLIERLPEPVIALSILEGWTEGKVFVDDDKDPQVVFVWETKNNLFLSGRPGDEVAARLEKLLSDVVIPYGERSRLAAMSSLSYTPDGWSGYLPGILRCRPPVFDRRACFTMDVRGVDATRAMSGSVVVPGGCELREVDRALLDPSYTCVEIEGNAPVAHRGLENLDEVRAEILKQWNSLDDFLAKGFGYCLVQSGAITSWCLAEYPAGNEISIGVETVEAFREKGHGTAVASAFIRKCVQRGITPYWDLWSSNVASKALAEKVGLKHKVTYPVVFFWYNEVDNLLVNANVAFRRDNRPDSAVGWYEKAFAAAELEGTPKGLMLSRASGRRRWLANAAEAHFAAGHRERALSHLRAARSTGLTEENAAALIEQWELQKAPRL